MNRMMILMLILLALAACAFSEPVKNPDGVIVDNFKVYWLIKTATPPVIDGKLDDAIWKQADPLQGWGTTDYGRQNEKLGDIDFRAAWDDTYLYIGARMYHKRKPEDMEEFRRSIADVSKAVYSRECLEIHINGNHDHETRFQAIGNALNERMMIWYYDFGWGLLTNPDYGLDADWDIVSAIEKDSWTLEARIALADIQVQPKTGYAFGLNPCWFNWADSRENGGYWFQFVTWSTHGNSHHDPKLYGHFILVDKKPDNLEQGLRLAYPDLDKRILMVQTDTGYLVFRDGKMTQQSYSERLQEDVTDARAQFTQFNDLFAQNKSAPEAYVKNQVDKQDAALKQIEQALAGDTPLNIGQVTTYRQDVAKIADSIGYWYWQAKMNFFLAGVTGQNK